MRLECPFFYAIGCDMHRHASHPYFFCHAGSRNRDCYVVTGLSVLSVRESQRTGALGRHLLQPGAARHSSKEKQTAPNRGAAYNREIDSELLDLRNQHMRRDSFCQLLRTPGVTKGLNGPQGRKHGEGRPIAPAPY